MPARTPLEAHQLFTEAIDAGDLNTILAVYEPATSIVPKPGQPAAQGIEAVGQVMQEFLAMKPQLQLRTTSVIEVGHLALLRSHWTLTGTDAQGQSLQMEHHSIEVVRRQADGTWLSSIDDPYGAD
jgi:uncharacterized protein (TIGR02246 family)